jgi:hypothetical protein
MVIPIKIYYEQCVIIESSIKKMGSSYIIYYITYYTLSAFYFIMYFTAYEHINIKNIVYSRILWILI